MVERDASGQVRLRLDEDEALVLGSLLRQVLELIGDSPDDAERSGGEADRGLPPLGIAETARRPDDPALARLFPDGYRDDEEAAEDFRRYTETTLRDGKRNDADTVLADLEHVRRGAAVVLDDEHAQVWLRALNDLRLALGTRLEITEEFYENYPDLEPDDPRFPAVTWYDWLTSLQDGLVRVLL